MSGWNDLLLDTPRMRRDWLLGFHTASLVLPECSPPWLDKLYRILSSDSPGDWPRLLGWDYTAYNEGLILGLYALVALQRLDQAT